MLTLEETTAFYTPYHLCHLEAPHTVARAVLFGDAAVSPDVGHVLDVVAAAKRDLKAGETLDGIGGYAFYGLAENAVDSTAAGHVPVAIADGSTMIRDVEKDELLRMDDIRVPADRLIEQSGACPPVPGHVRSPADATTIPS
jgi:predicted homoserine dehydrogenase-like protein